MLIDISYSPTTAEPIRTSTIVYVRQSKSFANPWKSLWRTCSRAIFLRILQRLCQCFSRSTTTSDQFKHFAVVFFHVPFYQSLPYTCHVRQSSYPLHWSNSPRGFLWRACSCTVCPYRLRVLCIASSTTASKEFRHFLRVHLPFYRP